MIFNGVLFVLIPFASWFLAKKTLQPIQIAHDQQKQFVSDVSHELRTPLAIIQGEMELALEKERLVCEYKQILHRAKQESKRLTSLVENLLFLARYDQNQRVISPKAVDVVDKIYQTMHKFEKDAKNKSIKLVFDPPEEGILVEAHESFISELLANLLDNAIKYSYPKGKIIVKCYIEHSWMILEVIDFGIGIPSNEKNKVWNRFYRVDPSRSETSGYGLGLAICKAIVSFYRGSIHFQSDGKTGTKFIVKIPLKFSSNSHNRTLQFSQNSFGKETK